jgi:hypothetical protein
MRADALGHGLVHPVLITPLWPPEFDSFEEVDYKEL